MIRITNIKLPISHTEIEMHTKIAKLLRVPASSIGNISIRRRSVDARNKPELFYCYTIDVAVKKEKQVVAHCKNEQISIAPDENYQFPQSGKQLLTHRPVIIGSGPAGMFCAWMLAKHGYCPLLLERGREVDQRVQDVECFWKIGKLNPQSNVQFGEGGAGTFSDGKLNTLVKDTSFRNKEVLDIFVKAGAEEKIRYDHKPHIGTDVLQKVVKNIRNQIIAWGGEVRFESQVTDFKIKDGAVKAVIVNETEEIPCEVAVLAIGHSARDTFYRLNQIGVSMQCKAFAVGMRIEHPQKMITKSQYGVEYSEELGAAPYKLTKQTGNGRGIYSFCMCPGGYVVNASSEEKRLAVNGMSNAARDTDNANAALIVTVTPDDFPNQTPLGGIEFQRQLEETAYKLGNGKIPVQLYVDFKKNRCSSEFGEVKPSMKGSYSMANLRTLLPEPLNESLIEGIESFGQKIKGFNRPDALLSGVESRTSSPVRISRNEVGQSNIRGLYPCGEGAGYAGGITSAAMDGLKIAEKIAQIYAAIKNKNL